MVSLSGFIDEEMDVYVSSPTNSMNELKNLPTDDEQLISEVTFIAESTQKLVELLTWFESRHVLIHMAHNRLMDLLSCKWYYKLLIIYWWCDL